MAFYGFKSTLALVMRRPRIFSASIVNLRLYLGPDFATCWAPPVGVTFCVDEPYSDVLFDSS